MKMPIFALPRSLTSTEKFELLLQRYKSFRLSSLEWSPQAFSSTHASEAAFPRERWEARLSNPLATNIIAVAATKTHDSNSDDEKLDQILGNEWLASLTLVGPLDQEAARKMLGDMHIDHKTCVVEQVKWYFSLSAMYVSPSARGKGIGAQLVNFAKRLVREQASGDNASVVLVVDYDNDSARHTYEKCGFVIVERYWFDDLRKGASGRTEAATMQLHINDGTDPKE